MHSLVGIGVAGMVGALVLPVGNAAAVVNDNIELQGQEFQVAMSPVYVEFDLVPGTTTGDTVRIRNVGSMETSLMIGVAPLEFSGDTTVLGTPRNEIVDWTTISLEPGCEAFKTDAKAGTIFVHMRVKEECHVRFSTKTPANAPFGEQYMYVFFQEYREDLADGMQMIRSIGTNIYGTNRTGASDGDTCFKMLDQNIPFWLFKGPLDTNATVENCGRLNFHTTIKIEVFNLFGKLVHEDQLPGDKIVIAESQRVMRGSWAEARTGIYKTKQTIEALGETYAKEGWTLIIPEWLVVVLLLCAATIVFSLIHGRKKKQASRHSRK